jgi:uncharacterized protein
MNEEKTHFEIEIGRILRDLLNRNPHISGLILVTEDGLPIVSMLPDNHDAERVSGLNSVLLNIGINSSNELKLGSVEQLMIRGTNGYLIVSSVSRGANLLVVTDKEVVLGAVFHFMKKVIKQLRQVI